jgi:hypothetical protein
LVVQRAFALEAAGIALSRIEDFFDATGQHAVALDDAHVRAGLPGLVTDGLPKTDGRGGKPRGGKPRREHGEGEDR